MAVSSDLACRFARLTFTLALAFAWAGGTQHAGAADAPPAAAPAGGPTAEAPATQPAALTEADRAKVADMLEKAIAQMDAGRKAMPRDSFDPQAAVALAGRDVPALFAWVRDNTYYQPYRGSLRGPAGVLMERAGNSLDRALLLCEMLRIAGHNVRLARATLTPEQAADLAKRVKPPPSGWRFPKPDAPKGGGDATALLAGSGIKPEVAQELLRKTLLQSQQMAENAAARVERDLGVVVAALGESASGKQASATPPVDAEHWWVQAGDGKTWTDFDPSAGDAQPGQAIVPAKQTIALDAKTGKPATKEPLWHEVAIRVVIEQFKSGKTAEKTVLEHVARPADLAGRQISLKHLPLGWNDANIPLGQPDAARKLTAAIAAHKEWRPMLIIGDAHTSNLSFDTRGELSKKAGDDPLASAGDMQGEMLSGLGGALRPGGGGGAPGILTAEWVEYEIRVPGSKPRKLRRAIFDVFGPAARAASTGKAGTLAEPKLDETAAANRGLAMLGEIEMLVSGGRLSMPYLFDGMTAGLVEARTHLLGLLREAKPDDIRDVARRMAKIHPQFGVLQALAISRDFWNGSADDVYIDAPNILTQVRRPRLAPDGQLVVREGIDIIENRVRARPGLDGPAAFRAVLRQGIADTAAEAVVINKPSPQNVSDLVQQTTGQGVGWRAATKAEDAGVAGAMSPDGAARARAALAEGAVLVLPEKKLSTDAAQTGWYRVDPATGQALGVLETGEGAAMAERAALILGGITAITTFLGCGGTAKGVSGHKMIACGLCAIASGFLVGMGTIAIFALKGVVIASTLLTEMSAAVGGPLGFLYGVVLTNMCNLIGYQMQ